MSNHMLTKLLVLLTILTGPSAWASRSSHQLSTGPSVRAPLLPFKKSVEDIEKYILELPRQQVSIHNVSSKEEYFLIKGSFGNKDKFNLFLEGVLGSSGGCTREKINLKTVPTTFAGITKFDFELLVQNKWC